MCFTKEEQIFLFACEMNLSSNNSIKIQIKFLVSVCAKWPEPTWQRPVREVGSLRKRSDLICCCSGWWSTWVFPRSYPPERGGCVQRASQQARWLRVQSGRPHLGAPGQEAQRRVQWDHCNSCDTPTASASWPSEADAGPGTRPWEKVSWAPCFCAGVSLLFWSKWSASNNSLWFSLLFLSCLLH